jgi:hypothetical protein
MRAIILNNLSPRQEKNLLDVITRRKLNFVCLSDDSLDSILATYDGKAGSVNRITGYAVVCRGASGKGQQPSHDWGGEFYYDKEEAKARAEELQATVNQKFWIKPAMFTIQN